MGKNGEDHSYFHCGGERNMDKDKLVPMGTHMGCGDKMGGREEEWNCHCYLGPAVSWSKNNEDNWK